MKRFVLYALISLSFTHVFGQWKYPATKTVDSSDNLWGVTYKDPYRWLENVKDTAV